MFFKRLTPLAKMLLLRQTASVFPELNFGEAPTQANYNQDFSTVDEIVVTGTRSRENSNNAAPFINTYDLFAGQRKPRTQREEIESFIRNTPLTMQDRLNSPRQTTITGVSKTQGLLDELLYQPFADMGNVLTGNTDYMSPREIQDAKMGILGFGIPQSRAGKVLELGMQELELGLASSKPLFSRLVDGGGLQMHEEAGGHLLLKHVGQTEQDLMTRLVNEPKIGGSSSFYDRATAENAISQLMDAKQFDISTWLSGTSNRLRIDTQLPSPVGISVARGATNAVNASAVKAVLVRDPSMSTGYKILTGFPTTP
jgi:hypothetical protein